MYRYFRFDDFLQCLKECAMLSVFDNQLAQSYTHPYLFFLRHFFVLFRESLHLTLLVFLSLYTLVIGVSLCLRLDLHILHVFRQFFATYIFFDNLAVLLQ